MGHGGEEEGRLSGRSEFSPSPTGSQGTDTYYRPVTQWPYVGTTFARPVE